MYARFVINSTDFAREAGQYDGKTSLVELVRLQDYLFNSEGELSYKISGALNENSKPTLHLVLKGDINLCCQRCLGKLTHTLDLQTTLLLVKNETELNQFDEDDSIDAIIATSTIDVLHLIEDELILSLPSSSRHQEGMCDTHKHKNESAVNKRFEHPFAALAALKKMH